MITADGKTRIKQYLAGQGGTLAGSIAVGIGSTAENINDTRLQFEVERFNIDVIGYDFVDNAIIFKGVLPEDIAGKFYEASLWSADADPLASGYGSRIITTFDSETETWDIETMESAIARIGVDSLKHTPAASGSTTSIQTGIELDLSGYSSADLFTMAYNVENNNTSSLRFRFYTDSSNYYDLNLGAQTTGYKFTSVTKGSATTTGSPDWSHITQLGVTTTSGAGGASAVEFDGIRIEDVDTLNPEYGLLARKVLPTPYTKELGQAQEFEYALTVNL